MRAIVFLLAALFSIAAAAQTQGTVQSINRAGTHATIASANGTVYQVNLVAERKAGTDLTRLAPGVPVLFTPGNGRTASNIEFPHEVCGSNSCGPGTYCCNASCGICAPLGGGCIQIFCGGTTP